MDASVNTLLMVGGGLACAAVSAIGLRDGVRWWRRRRRLRAKQAAERAAFRAEVSATVARAQARRQPPRAWEGLRTLRVMAIVDECRDVKSFYLAAPDGRSLPAYLPGQYLTLHLRPHDSGPPVIRCYSLSDRPHEESYRITVKRCAAPAESPHAPDGVGSAFLHDAVRVGDELSVAAPAGDFHLDPAVSGPLALVAGGIGVTPILAMASELVHRGYEHELFLVLGMRNRAQFPFREAVEVLRDAAPNVRLLVAYSQPDRRAVAGRDFQHRGHVTIDYLRSALPSSDFHFYVCGPPRMMHGVVPGLLEWGAADDRIHFEAFGPASVPPNERRDEAAAAVGLPVRFAQRNAEAVWPAECHTLLELAEQAGVPLESGCRVGNCGRCATPVVEGSVTTIKRPGATPPPGQCLACISVPTSPLVLDA